MRWSYVSRCLLSRTFYWMRRRVDPIAIDFGTRCVRMLQLAQQRGQTTVIACAERALPPGSRSSADYDHMRMEAVKDMLAEKAFIGRQVITSLGWEETQVRNLRVPNMPEEEIGDVIRYEAGERFGLDPDKAELRFMVAGDVRQGTEMRQEVIVLAAGRPEIDAHLNLLSKLGLQPAAIDAGPCALFRSFERFLRREEDRNSVNAFVEMGYSATRVVVSRGPKIIFFKSIPIGGSRFDELVAEQMDLQLNEAVELRIRLYRQHVCEITGQAPDKSQEEPVGESIARAVLDALRPALEQLAKEIALCLRYCSVTFRGIRSNEVTVVGGEACNHHILRMLSDQINLPFHVGRPMRNVGAEPDFDGADRRTGQPEWATVLGLALKPIRNVEEAAA